jgi:hypothetical protein
MKDVSDEDAELAVVDDTEAVDLVNTTTEEVEDTAEVDEVAPVEVELTKSVLLVGSSVGSQSSVSVGTELVAVEDGIGDVIN